jgi:hypothetical protein
VVLRAVLGQGERLRQWETLAGGVASALAEPECLRALERLALIEGLSDAEIASSREGVHRVLAAVELVEPTRAILARAAQPAPTTLGTLQAVHLATALAWREATGRSLAMATHDPALALAARASGLPVIGA